MKSVLEFLRENEEKILEDVGMLVNRETPSTDKACLDDCADFLADFVASRTRDCAIDFVDCPNNGKHLLVRWGSQLEGKPLLLVGHYDTVWPHGTLADMPFRVEDGKASGPGIFDMKCGLVQGIWAVKAVQETTGLNRPVVLLVNSDEEIGSPSSRSMIEAQAREACAAIILEPSANGAIKTQRKGVGIFHLQVTGRASHAGLEPDKGISANEELAHLIPVIHGFTDRSKGTTVNVGTMQGGTRINVIAAQAEAEIDVRVETAEEVERVTALLQNLKPRHEDVLLHLEGGINRPPMERSQRIGELFEQARELAAELDLELHETSVGGGSDGNFCAAVGTPVLDGMGAVGDGAHALHEHVDVASIPLRAALVARLITTIRG